MIHDPQHTISTMSALKHAGLRLGFVDGTVFDIDLTETIRDYLSLSLAAMVTPVFATAG